MRRTSYSWRSDSYTLLRSVVSENDQMFHCFYPHVRASCPMFSLLWLTCRNLLVYWYAQTDQLEAHGLEGLTDRSKRLGQTSNQTMLGHRYRTVADRMKRPRRRPRLCALGRFACCSGVCGATRRTNG